MVNPFSTSVDLAKMIDRKSFVLGMVAAFGRECRSIYSAAGADA
jgi:hypothetical protein